MKSTNKKHPVTEDKPTRATTGHGSTTQGGSNFGQGSIQLGNSSAKQGSESNKGSNYEDEQGWNNEALRSEDIDKKKKDK